MNMSNVKENILTTLRSTQREHIGHVIEYMLKHGFFDRGCHGHHKYVGGLADHAWQTFLFAKDAENEYCKNNPNHKMVSMESLALCCLLHDFCDCHGMKKLGGHGLRSAMMLTELGLYLSKEEFLAIRFHMSLKNHTKHPLYDDASHCHLCYIVHLADGLSAKSYRGSSITKS